MAVDFTPHPDIAPCKSVYDKDPGKWVTYYRYDYQKAHRLITEQPEDIRERYAKGVVRALVQNDLFYILYFIQGIVKANHPFIVKQCHMVQDGPQSDTLDVWSRYHFKSTILTVAETLQYHLNNPEHCTAILGYARPVAKKFLRSIKTLCESNVTLKWAFRDILWDNPVIEAPKWSEDDGIVFKRSSASRGESTIEAWGLTEGAPTGRHFERLVFDDIETEDIAKSPKVMEDVFSKFEMNVYNLGTGSDTDRRRIIGTYYNFRGPIKRIEEQRFDDIVDAEGNRTPGRPMYQLRLVPATDDGKITGKPVLLDPQTWERLKRNKHVNSQQLCDPAPTDDIILDSTLLNPIEPEFLWKGRFKFMVIDQAGGAEANLNPTQGDLWSIGVVSIMPASLDATATDDDLGISDVCLEDLVADQMTHGMAIDTIVRMYLKHGLIYQLGVERVGLSTTEIHIAEALAKKGRKLSVDHNNLVLLRPAGRSVEDRIKGALEWPLNNGKLFYSTTISQVYLERVRMEMDQLGYNHPDILNMWAYAYDMFKTFPFHRHKKVAVRSVTSAMASSPIRGDFG